jgi:hypothetical protein
VIARTLVVSAAELERVTGWHLTPDGLCREDRCIPFSTADPDAIDLVAVASALGRPLVRDERHGLFALGAESGGHALTSAAAPDLVLPDMDGRMFSLASLRGRNVLLVAWASW